MQTASIPTPTNLEVALSKALDEYRVIFGVLADQLHIWTDGIANSMPSWMFRGATVYYYDRNSRHTPKYKTPGVFATRLRYVGKVWVPIELQAEQEPIIQLKIVAGYCDHAWKPYVGLMESYEYCIICNIKKEDNL